MNNQPLTHDALKAIRARDASSPTNLQMHSWSNSDLSFTPSLDRRALLAEVDRLAAELEATLKRERLVEEIVLGMEDIADHGAFISRDPYEYTTALRAALTDEKGIS